jgi:hypothetical protein
MRSQRELSNLPFHTLHESFVPQELPNYHHVQILAMIGRRARLYKRPISCHGPASDRGELPKHAFPYHAAIVVTIEAEPVATPSVLVRV